jgi:hypothetical protein
MGNRDYKNRETKKPKKKDPKLARAEKRTGEQTGLLKEQHHRIAPPETAPEE